MRILADANVEHPIVVRLRSDGHDVLYTAEVAPRMLDPDVLRQSVDEGRILLSNDKDFSMLTFFQHQVASGIIMMRLPTFRTHAKGDRLMDVLRHGYDFDGYITVIKPNTVRRRRFPSLG